MEEDMNKLVIAHMGASHYKEKNTIPALKLAVLQKADIIEMDIRKTKDNVLILNHDRRILGKSISRHTYSHLKSIKQDLCTLEEALQELNNKVRLDIHLKEKGYELSGLKIILKHLKKEDFFISTSYFSTASKIKKNLDSIKVGLVIEIEPKNILYLPFGYYPKKDMFKSNIDYIIPRRNIVNKRFIKKAEKYKIPVYIWVVNSEKVIKKFLNSKIVKGYITDRPDFVREKLKRLNKTK